MAIGDIAVACLIVTCLIVIGVQLVSLWNERDYLKEWADKLL